MDLSLQLTAFLVSKLFCKKVEITIYILGSSLLNNQYSLSELFKYGKLLHKYRGGQFYWWRKAEYPAGENHRPATSHRQTLSHNAVSSIPRLSWIHSVT